MTDRRESDPELARQLSTLEGTLTELRERLDEEWGQPGPERRRPPGRREGPSLPRPPRMRELLRFTEQQTIPTLVAILEANIRLLELAGAALRAVDPERSVDESREATTVSRALDAGGRLSTDGLRSGLGELQEALSGTEAPTPEARELLEEAERLSAEVEQRLRESEGGLTGATRGSGSEASEPVSGGSSGPVQIDVEDATSTDETSEGGSSDDAAGVDVDAELDSIREEVRGDATDDGAEDGDTGEGDDAGDDSGDDADEGDDAVESAGNGDDGESESTGENHDASESEEGADST